VSAWGGDVVTTVFVHVAVQGSTLYLEFSAWMLPPTRPEFALPAAHSRWVRAAGGALVRVPVTAVAAPFGVLGQLGRIAIIGVRAVRRVMVDEPDHGVRQSVRELAAVDVAGVVKDDLSTYALDNYAQAHDAAKYAKILERQLIATVLDLLQAREVDTSEYRQRVTAILNYGVMQFGGRLDLRDSDS
jgi:hypothetical protein